MFKTSACIHSGSVENNLLVLQQNRKWTHFLQDVTGALVKHAPQQIPPESSHCVQETAEECVSEVK